MTIRANTILRESKKDFIILIAPIDTEKGWFVDVCHNYKTGKETKALRQRLEACNTFEGLVIELQGYSSNVPNI